ncbi:MAG: hypothetical protein LBE01_00725 [Deltaproteobacteria bacterium]|nr:hypothetical protein [Deltaproteobacteria bacterium]
MRVRLSKPPEIPPDGIDVSAWPGVKKLTPNYHSGSFLLEYDPDKLSLETIADVVEQFDAQAAEDLKRIANGGHRYRSAETHSHHRSQNQTTSDFISLGISLISSVVTAFWGPKRWHVQCGLFLAGLSVAHAWHYRHRVKPISKWTIHDILGLPAPRPIYVDPPEEPDEAAPLTESAA